MKTSIALSRLDNGVYKVVSLTNRIEPTVGRILNHKEVEELIRETKYSNLTVTIKPNKES